MLISPKACVLGVWSKQTRIGVGGRGKGGVYIEILQLLRVTEAFAIKVMFIRNSSDTTYRQSSINLFERKVLTLN